MQESPPSILSPQPQGGPQPNNRWFPYRSAGDFDANLILILIILFSSLVLAVSLNAALRCYLRRCHRRRQLHSPRQPDVSKPPPPDTDTSLPTLSFSTSLQLAGAAAGVAAECAICLTEFLSGDQVRVLPKCNHGFHVKCIQLWLTSHASCPTCRTCCLSPAPEVAAAAQVERRSPETVAEP